MNTSSKSMAPSDAPTPASRIGALSGLSLSMLLSSLGTSIANVGLPTMAKAFDASFQRTQWVVLAYLLAVTATALSVGRLGDLLGRRRLLLAGLLLFTAASGVCAVATSFGLLVAARAAQGIGAAVMMVLAMASVGAVVPKERTGSAMGLLGTMSAVGTALGPSLGGALIAGFGWPALFWINLPLGALAAILAWRYLAAAPPPAGPVRFDVPGTVLLAATLAAYALAMTSGGGSVGASNVALLLVAAAGFVAFVAVERHAASPLVALALFRAPAFRAGFAASAVVMTVMMATLVVGPFHLSQALGLDAAHVGLAMSCGPVVSALTGVPAGRLVDRVGAQRMMLAGLAVMAAGCGALALLPLQFGVAGYVLPLVGITAGYASFQAGNNTAVMSGALSHERGAVSGLLALSRNLGLVTGASAMGAVFAFGTGAGDLASASSTAVAAGTRLTFATAAATVLVTMAFVFAGMARRATGVEN